MGFRGPQAPATGRLQKSLGLLCRAACLLHNITLQLSWDSGLRESQIPGLSTQLWPLAAKPHPAHSPLALRPGVFLGENNS